MGLIQLGMLCCATLNALCTCTWHSVTRNERNALELYYLMEYKSQVGLLQWRQVLYLTSRSPDRRWPQVGRSQNPPPNQPSQRCKDIKTTATDSFYTHRSYAHSRGECAYRCMDLIEVNAAKRKVLTWCFIIAGAVWCSQSPMFDPTMVREHFFRWCVKNIQSFRL